MRDKHDGQSVKPVARAAAKTDLKETATPKAAAAKATAANAASSRRGDGMPVGKPFPKKVSGNPRGRPPKRKLSPAEITFATLTRDTKYTQLSTTRFAPRLELILEDVSRRAAQGDDKAARTLATLVRAVRGFDAPPKNERDAARKVKDRHVLDKVLEKYNRRLWEGGPNEAPKKSS